jgi:hypothetical protein
VLTFSELLHLLSTGQVLQATQVSQALWVATAAATAAEQHTHTVTSMPDLKKGPT